MMRSMFSAISGLKNHSVMLDVTANNIANVNTLGFKGSRTTFQDSLAQLQRGASSSGAGVGGSNAAQIGLGVRLGSIDNIMNGGAVQTTGSPLDVAIQGDGWFRVGLGTPVAGNPAAGIPNSFDYTRAGNFTRNQAGYVTTQDGYYVIGRDAPGGGGADRYLNVPAGASDLAVGQDGSISFTPPGGGVRQTAGYISLAKFANEAGLERSAGNRFSASAASGTEAVNTPGGNYGMTVGGTVEMSNVDLANEFTSMITAQRGFQANSRVISAADQLLQDLVNLNR